jgi:hypothetical protein
MLMCAFLGITTDMPAAPVPYLRVLAFNDMGRALLKRMGEVCALPVVVKPAHAKAFGDGRRFFECEALACDLFSLFSAVGEGRSGGADWKKTPVYVRPGE